MDVCSDLFIIMKSGTVHTKTGVCSYVSCLRSFCYPHVCLIEWHTQRILVCMADGYEETKTLLLLYICWNASLSSPHTDTHFGALIPWFKTAPSIQNMCARDRACLCVFTYAFASTSCSVSFTACGPVCLPACPSMFGSVQLYCMQRSPGHVLEIFFSWDLLSVGELFSSPPLPVKKKYRTWPRQKSF
jgi:hypothetical protein